MPRRAEIVAEGRTWVGTPWRHQGRLKGVGVDCLGVMVGIGLAFGYTVADRLNYARRPDGRELMAGLDAHLERIAGIEAAAVVLFEVDRQPQHVGLIADGPLGFRLIHALAPARKVVEQDFSPTWPGPVVGFWRFPGVSD
jgi:cell wall-associated NlpC family hydrolase